MIALDEKADKKPEICYVINHIDWFWSHRLPLARGAQEAGWQVSVAVPGASADENLTDEGFKGIDLPAPDQGFGPLGVVKTMCALRRIIRRDSPDLVHAITLKYAFITGLATLGLSHVKLVHTIAGLGYLFSGEGIKPKILRTVLGPFLRLALRRKNIQLIFQNPDDMNMMISRGFADPSQAHLIRGSGVDTHEFTPSDTPEATENIVVMPTRLVHDKGVAVFVDAARILKQQGVNAVFQIAGGVTHNNPLAISQGDMEAMVKDGAAEWLGKVSDMPALLAKAALVAYPSYYREGIPKVLLEAASMAKAIVTTDHPGCKEAVNHGENGLLVPVKDAQSLADAIKKLLDDPAERHKMGQRSRQRATEEFDVKIIVAQTLETYSC